MTVVDYGVLKYEIGTDLGHFGIAVPDVSAHNARILDKDK